jgi:hypothetical protein
MARQHLVSELLADHVGRGEQIADQHNHVQLYAVDVRHSERDLIVAEQVDGIEPRNIELAEILRRVLECDSVPSCRAVSGGRDHVQLDNAFLRF